MPKGTVKFFSAEKGYGFIRSDGVQSDIFVHHSAIQMEGYRQLETGQQVEFELRKDEKGFKAVNVVPISAAAPEQAAAQTPEQPTT